jgi:uncharacterized membrane protein HdeD (DUF308 family)
MVPWGILKTRFNRFPVGRALGALTLLLAAYFVATGVVQVIGAFGARPEQGWGWLMFGGVISVLLGLLLWR